MIVIMTIIVTFIVIIKLIILNLITFEVFMRFYYFWCVIVIPVDRLIVMIVLFICRCVDLPWWTTFRWTGMKSVALIWIVTVWCWLVWVVPVPAQAPSYPSSHVLHCPGTWFLPWCCAWIRSCFLCHSVSTIVLV